MPEKHLEFAVDRDQVRNRITGTASRLSVERFGPGLRAVVLTGSMARHEATIVPANGGWRVLGDAEFLLVFQQHAPFPAREEIRWLSEAVEDNLRSHLVDCPVEFAPAKPAYLRTLPPHIFGYELRECGRVVWGDASVLSAIPSFSPSEIPLEDGWRLLSNRIVEHLDVARASTIGFRRVPSSLQHHTVKLCLDTAGSFLLFAGAYAPTYERRQKRLEFLWTKPRWKEPYPFLRDAFAREVDFCTQWKLGKLGTGSEPQLSWDIWESVISTACDVWRWELSLLTGLTEHADFHELCRHSMRAQTANEKFRGWLLVLRETGWLRSWRMWPGWLGKARRGSPRHCIYLAAFELFSKLSALLGGKASDSEWAARWTEIRGWLPLAGPAEQTTEPADWRRLASEIAWNYHAFVDKTRA